MDQRHLTFLRRNGVDMYNCYFNRDKKITVPEDGPTPQRMTGASIKDDPPQSYRMKYDPFLYEYRDGDIAVPRPPDIERKWLEPESSHYKNVPLEYIREHGALEFILESEYPYSLDSLFHYSKPSQYQMDYLRKLIKEGRLTQKVFRL